MHVFVTRYMIFKHILFPVNFANLVIWKGKKTLQFTERIKNYFNNLFSTVLLIKFNTRVRIYVK